MSFKAICGWRSVDAVLQEVQNHAVELVSIFPLHPVATAIEDVQLGTLDTVHQANTGIHGYKAIIATPDNKGFVFDLTDRKSTRLNSSHVRISYAVFCLKKK